MELTPIRETSTCAVTKDFPNILGKQKLHYKLPLVQLPKTFPTFWGSRSFITVFTRALHVSVS
jgi:hypothetical protein